MKGSHSPFLLVIPAQAGTERPEGIQKPIGRAMSAGFLRYLPVPAFGGDGYA
jgi:hypothetical protein